ncbi:MAG: hypothetical protein IJX39_08490 [Clostridia bacterium]|nr:hypothetical protein [Clostridia bacterium]
MSKDAIRQIRETEDQAAVLCRVAEEKAAEMREQVRQKGEEHCALVRESTEAEYAAELTEMRRRATALEAKKRAEAEAEAKVLKAAAREKINEAVKIIVWEIVEKCQ